ncbi:MAG TPA: alpha/beta hydrolase, partial [Candidatus Dormibacteraeota bacterium]|nr:alpha/beta hydrolase [Candidatus Dormibacteraeota bacterium]
VPVRRLVFLAAFLPVPGKSAMDQRSTEPIDPPAIATTSEWTDLGEDVWSIGPDTARELFLHDVAGDVAASAIERLRPQCYRVMTEMTPLTAWPDVPSDYVVCADDRALSAAWGRRASRDRLGVGAIELPGGHCPMLSRPDQLATTLDRLARGS